MNRFLFLALSIFLFSGFVTAQTAGSAATSETNTEKTKKATHRPTKEQITEAQTKLRSAGTYSGTVDGASNADFRAAVKTYQGSNGLRRSGALNRATLEKMSIALTDEQKAIPISPSSYVKAKAEKPSTEKAETASTDKPKRGPVFRATKGQINEAQRKLKAGNMYAGEEIGKLDDATREGLKKYQEANGLKVTGTLNQVTLEKMGIELTDTQKANAVAVPAN